MMQNTLRKSLLSEIKEGLFDIVIYGSSVKGKLKPNDLDVALIFLEGSLRERLDRAQQIKNKIKGEAEQKIDIKALLLKELFTPEFFGKTGLFLEGISVLTGKPFSERIGFRPYSLFTYSLDGLGHTKKIQFNYILTGRSKAGLISSLNGVRIGKGAVKIPIEKADEFETVLKDNQINYKRVNLLEEI